MSALAVGIVVGVLYYCLEKAWTRTKHRDSRDKADEVMSRLHRDYGGNLPVELQRPRQASMHFPPVFTAATARHWMQARSAQRALARGRHAPR